MTDTRLEMQQATVARLKAQVAAVSGRVRDRVPQGDTFPFIALAFQVIEDGAEDVDGFEIIITVHVWSRAVGYPEAAGIGSAVRAALHNWRPSLTDPAASGPLRHRDTLQRDQSDGLTTHLILTFEAFTESI